METKDRLGGVPTAERQGVVRTPIAMETDNPGRYTFRSPSGSLELEADGRVLIVKGRVGLHPILATIGVSPLVVIAGYLLCRQGPIGVVIGAGLLAWAAYIFDKSRRSTTLRLVRDDVEATESRLLTRWHKRIKLRPVVDVGAESVTDENDGYINFLRLPGQRASKLDLLKGHNAQDVVWVWAAINHWRRGGPHKMALHLSALARRR
jgi:hypothetical protein